MRALVQRRLAILTALCVLMSVLVLPVGGATAIDADTYQSARSSVATTTIGVPDLQPMATTYVYIMRTGKRYHRHSCRECGHHTHYKVTIKEARRRGRTPCLICRPPSR